MVDNDRSASDRVSFVWLGFSQKHLLIYFPSATGAIIVADGP